MNKERKTNIIKALKEEIYFYKHLKAPVVYETIDLRHLRLQCAFSPEEVYQMPRDVISDLLIRRLAEQFESEMITFPIETEYNNQLRFYKAHLDIWVKPKHGPWEVNR